MLATLAELKASLSITGSDQDALLNSCLAQANALIASYLGADLSDTSDKTYEDMLPEGATFVHLPVFPIIEVSVLTINGVAVPPSDFTLVKRQGGVFFDNMPGTPGHAGNVMSATYKAGFQTVPTELNTPCLNIAATIYNRGGQIATASGENELKSLTMFDAMSMSFDTTKNSLDSPDGLIATWSFMLSPYRVKAPVFK